MMIEMLRQLEESEHSQIGLDEYETNEKEFHLNLLVDEELVKVSSYNVRITSKGIDFLRFADDYNLSLYEIPFGTINTMMKQHYHYCYEQLIDKHIRLFGDG